MYYIDKMRKKYTPANIDTFYICMNELLDFSVSLSIIAALI